MAKGDQADAAEAGGKERVFVDVLQATDDYLAVCEQLASALKGGWFSLARAKYAAASAASLGQAAYPGNMQASAAVGVVEPSDPDDLYDRFELRRAHAARVQSGLGASSSGGGGGGGGEGGEHGVPPAAADGPAGEGGSGAGGGGAGARASKASGGGGGDAGAGDPLQWFGGGLPPADLRQAQREFRAALAAAVAAANQLQRLRARADALLDCSGGGDGGGGDGDMGDELEAGTPAGACCGPRRCV